MVIVLILALATSSNQALASIKKPTSVGFFIALLEKFVLTLLNEANQTGNNRHFSLMLQMKYV